MHDIPPDEIFAKPKRVRMFMYASDDIEMKLREKGGNK